MNEVFVEYCWVDDILDFDNGANNGKECGGIDGIYRSVGMNSNGNGNRGYDVDSW